MPGIYLSDEEMTALCGAPALVQRLYVFGIRRSMDFDTGVAGVSTPISWHGLARELRVESAPGIKEELPSKPQVRRAAQHLIKRGLVDECSEGLQLIFRCKLARLNKSFQKKADTKPTHQPNIVEPESRHTESPVDKGLQVIPDSIPGTEPDTSNFTNPAHVRGSENNHTVPYQDSSQIFTDAIDWVDYFITQHRFQPHRARTAASMPLFGQWCKDNITVGEMNEVVAIANLKNGTPPDSPVFYRRFVQQYRLERQRAEEKTNTQLFAVGQNYAPDQPARPAGKPDSSKQQTRQRVTAAVMDIKDTSW